MEKQACDSLEQMQIYMKLNPSGTEEYKQVEIIFNGLAVALGDTNYKNLLKSFNDTSQKIAGIHIRSLTYWEDYLKFIHWKMRQPSPNMLYRFVHQEF